MNSGRTDLKRLIIVGLPRSGTTLVATLLGAQAGIHFLTDYFPAFTEALRRLEKPWNAPLDQRQRRIALALVRDQFLRVRHPVLVKLDAFATLDELHQQVLAELAAKSDAWIGHKLLLPPADLRSTLAETSIHCLLLVRDVRDAALSFFHRTGGGVERYARNWCETLRVARQLETHPRLLALRFEDLLESPEFTLAALGRWLGVALDMNVSQLRFQRSQAHGTTHWSENSAFQDVKGRFDRQPLGRWRSQLDSPIVRYAGWVGRRELEDWGYEAMPRSLSPRERFSLSCLRAIEVTEHRAHDSVSAAGRWLKRRLARPLAP